ncbi:hypothetical protein D9757_008501 [Collybiopsis confluens]|uniref:Uncharacterized protein n=1 Tax=Collybiopsis confluens TaxID=2823264 RepID=A0A8H5H2R7_9AGAR|nr:hypothetical protein D9757_008501 [Collybiopsis confluens]
MTADAGKRAPHMYIPIFPQAFAAKENSEPPLHYVAGAATIDEVIKLSNEDHGARNLKLNYNGNRSPQQYLPGVCGPYRSAFHDSTLYPFIFFNGNLILTVVLSTASLYEELKSRARLEIAHGDTEYLTQSDSHYYAFEPPLFQAPSSYIQFSQCGLGVE